MTSLLGQKQRVSRAAADLVPSPHKSQCPTLSATVLLSELPLACFSSHSLTLAFAASPSFFPMSCWLLLAEHPMLFFVGMTVSLVHSAKLNKSNRCPQRRCLRLNGALTSRLALGSEALYAVVLLHTPPRLTQVPASALRGHCSLEMNRLNRHSPPVPARAGSRLHTPDLLCRGPATG